MENIAVENTALPKSQELQELKELKKSQELKEYSELIDAVTKCNQQLALIRNAIFLKDGTVTPRYYAIERCKHTKHYTAKKLQSILSEAHFCMVALHAYMVESNQGLYERYAEQTWGNYKA